MGWGSAIKKRVSHGACKKPTIVEPRPIIHAEEIDWARLVSLDFETFFDVDYTLSKLSTSEYIRDPRFKAQMVGIKIGYGKTKIVPAKRIAAELKKINWATHSLLCHNAQFDGFILSHHYGIIPARYYCTMSMARGLHSNEIGTGLDEVSIYSSGQGKIEGALEKTKGVLNWPKALYDETALYCANDVDEMFRIFTEMAPKFPADEMQLVHMTIRMFCNPVLKVDIPRVEKEYKREVDRREELMLTAVDQSKFYDDKSVLKTVAERALTGKERDMLVTKRVIGSNEKFADLLRTQGVNPPVKISPAWIKKNSAEKGEAVQKLMAKNPDLDYAAAERELKWAYAFAKDDLEFIGLPDQGWEAWPDLDPNNPSDVLKLSARQSYLNELVEVRIAVKSTTNITRAERFLKAGANGWSLPVGYAYARAHCLLGNAEVLTPSGWTRLDEWHGGPIMQWEPSGAMKFDLATPNEFHVNEEVVVANSRYHSAVYTKGHNLPGFTSAGTFKPRLAGDAANARFELPICGRAEGDSDISTLDMKIAVMVQADGNIRTDVSNGRCVRFGFKKQRKIERCTMLLNDASVPFTMHVDSEGSTRITVGAKSMHMVLRLLNESKKEFLPEILTASLEAKQAFIEELMLWDGCKNNVSDGIVYGTTNEQNAMMVQTMAHLCGRSAVVAQSPRGRWADLFSVYIRKDTQTRSEPKHYSTRRHAGKVYCPSTNTGYFLMRQNGRIVVTGNTLRWGGNNKMNMQNLTRAYYDSNKQHIPGTGELRLSILAAKGHQMAVVDSGQIEARVNGWLWDQHDLLDAFRVADTWDKSKGVARGANRDAYCRFADLVYGREITTDDKLERFVGKVCVLGLGFQMGAAKFQMTLAKGALGGPKVVFPLEQCHQIVQTYRRKNSRIAAGWEQCKEWIEHMANPKAEPIQYKCLEIGYGYILLPNGLTLKYHDLKKAMGDKGWEEWTYQAGENRKKIYGGLLCENLVQALARIIVATQMVWIDKKYPVVMTTHDECVTHPKTAQAQKCFDFMMKCMKTAPDWCSDIPLAAEGGTDYNYSK